ncbi:macro domain-containing protein [Croceicoccus gelatinilyticus]|uniref:macro domain-containing protein n=1 Tax=Croceicoccus gelatinilyticus TaxID=2835536 RepID=UPI001BD040B6|nr:macro domain-containing protein [Croceicoccus gelatinilyticus]MBS7671680.1 macro domain-containing protein [Croceicoccus gelatinilyticus]
MAFKQPGQVSGLETLSYVSGNIVDDRAQVLVNTVNCQLSRYGNGVMGKGVALAFKERFPSIMADYEAAIRSGEMRPGRALLFDLPDGRKWAALGTKDHFRDPSEFSWVDKGLAELGEKMREAGLKSVALPPPGCGNGGLDWKKVEPLVHQHLEGLSVSLYAKPSGAMVMDKGRLIERPEDVAREAAQARDKDAQKPLYGKLAAPPEASFDNVAGRMVVNARLMIREADGKRPIPVNITSDRLENGKEFDVMQDFMALKEGDQISAAGRWRKRDDAWQFNAARVARGRVPLSGMKSDMPSPDILGDWAIETLRQAGPAPEKAQPRQERGHAVDETTRVKLEATMYFAYGADARPGMQQKSTFDAILEGQRTSTTRLSKWGGLERWERLKEGDLVRFYADKDKSGRSVVVKVQGVDRVNLARATDAEVAAWSKAEGWSEKHGRELGLKGEAAQIRYVPVPGQAVLEGRPTNSPDFAARLEAEVKRQMSAPKSQPQPTQFQQAGLAAALGQSLGR